MSTQVQSCSFMMNGIGNHVFQWDTLELKNDQYKLLPRSRFLVKNVSSRIVHDPGMPNLERYAQESDDDTEVQMLLEDDGDADQSFFSSTYSNDGDDWHRVNGETCYSKTRDCPSFYGDDDDDDSSEEFLEREDELSESSVRTPPVELQQDLLYSEFTRKVTPEPAVIPAALSIPDLTEVQRQVQRTLKKLASSMRRSEETGRLIKRQRLLQSEENEALSGRMNDLFVSSHCDIEATRRQVYDMIHLGGSS